MYVAGVCISGLIETMSRDQIDLMFNINTIGVIRLTQAVLPHMKQRKEGKIIAVTSLLGRFGKNLWIVLLFQRHCRSPLATKVYTCMYLHVLVIISLIQLLYR